MSITSNTELLDIARRNNIKLDAVCTIYDDNALRYLKSLNEYKAIILLSPSEQIMNGHWVAVMKYKHNTRKGIKTEHVYFDSFGIVPNKKIEKLFNNDFYSYNNVQIQKLSANYCGIFSLMFLKYVKDKPSYFNFIEHYGKLNLF